MTLRHMKTSRPAKLPLSTQRLLLRRPVSEDADILQQLGNNRSLARMVARVPYPLALEDVTRWIEESRSEKAPAGDVALVIALKKAPDQPVGTCSAHFEGIKDIYCIGYWLGEAYWGQGYAPEAVHAMVDFLMAGCAAQKITAWYANDNPASRHVLEKNGFTDAGVQGPVHSLGRGMYVPCTLMERRI